MHRNISFKKMIFLLSILIGVGLFMIYDLASMYYKTYENKSTNMLIEKDNETNNVLDVFGYKITLPDLEIFTK